MTAPKTIQAQCARIMVAHMASITGTAAKARYLDALHKKLKAKSVKGIVTLDVCQWCYMPMVGAYRGCKRCANSFPCGGPYCLSREAALAAEVLDACAACGKRDLCPSCADQNGCINCGRVFCDQCAYVHKKSKTGDANGRERITFSICTEECARKTAKRARVGE